MMKKMILTISFLLLPIISFGQTANVGIIKGIWFSDAPFFDGEKVRVYTALQNNSGGDVEGVLEFYEDGVSLGKKTFSALDNRVIESWIDTVAKEGEREFSVKIISLSNDGGATQINPIDSEFLYSESIAVVKKDTDGDKIPNDIDVDDDGDGFSDEEEIKSGSNPLDEKEVPEKKEENNNSENETETIIDEIKKIFSGSNSNSDSKGSISKKEKEEKAEEVKEEQKKEKEIYIEEKTPEIVKDFSEKSSLAEVASSVVSEIQYGGTQFLEKEKGRVEEKIEPTKKVEIKKENNVTSSDGERTELEKEDLKEKRSWSGFFWQLYYWILWLISWLFSIWWLVVILLFVAIWLFLRILFRIFGARDRD